MLKKLLFLFILVSTIVFGEFVIGYEASPTPSGQPLPGVLVSSIVGMCTVGIISKRRHRRKE